MIESAKTKGLTTEKMMWQGVDDLNDMLCIMKKEHPDKYWSFIRKQHGVLFGNHYDEEFAFYDVSQLKYTNKKGEKKEGGYWSVEQVEEATKGRPFPMGVNKWDKYVAANVAYSDMCKKFDDSQIIEIMYLMYFADEDWGGKNGSATKIWDYMCLNNSMK